MLLPFVVTLVVAGEIVIFLLRPRWLARIAWAPLALRRVIPLSPALREELAMPPAETGYRQPPRPVLSLERLRHAVGARRIPLVDATVRLEDDGRLYLVAQSTARRRFFRSTRTRPWLVASFGGELRSEAIVLRARAYPVPTAGLLAFWGALLAVPPFEPRSAVAALVATVFLGAINCAWNRRVVRDALDFLEDELRR